MRLAVIPYSSALTIAMMVAPRPTVRVMPATKAPGVTCWKYTENTKQPTRPDSVTSANSIVATSAPATTLGTTNACTGLMPITRIASSSSRIVRAPRSAHIAVAPAPATTSTSTIGPIWIAARAAAVPDRSAAPISISKMLRMNTTNVVNGIASRSAGASDTRAMNQVWSRNSRQANGLVNSVTMVSSVNAKNPPTARSGLVATPEETVSVLINSRLPGVAPSAALTTIPAADPHSSDPRGNVLLAQPGFRCAANPLTLAR